MIGKLLNKIRHQNITKFKNSINKYSTLQAQQEINLPYKSINKSILSKYIRDDIEITEGMISCYERNGFIIVENLLTESQLELWRKYCDNAVYSRDDDWCFPEKGQQDVTNVDFDYYKNVFRQRVNLFKTNENMNELVLYAGYIIGKIAYTLEQMKLNNIKNIRLWHDQALYKEGFGNSTSWHNDNPYWSFNSFHSISCWVALDDVTYENGCVVYMPKSHNILKNKGSEEEIFKEVKIGKNMNDFFNYHPELKELKCYPGIMKAGSCGFHNGLLAHSASCNFTNKTRRAMTFQMFPNNCKFNGKQNILTDKQFKSKTIGDLLNNDFDNPILYQPKEYN